jgi:hypothetical protein
MACSTQEEIATAEDLPRETVRDLTGTFGDFGKLAESAKAAASHATDFDTPPYQAGSGAGKEKPRRSGASLGILPLILTRRGRAASPQLVLPRSVRCHHHRAAGRRFPAAGSINRATVTI